MAYQGEADVDVDLRALFGSLAAKWRRILAVALIATGAAFLLTMVLTPKYQAETRILIETGESVFTRPQTGQDTDRPLLDEEGVTSQVEVIGSTDLLNDVAKKLDLASKPEFDEAASLSAIDRTLILLGLKNDPGSLALEERILKAMRERLTVYRVEKSRVIVIEFSSEDPELAAAVPNAIADAYIGVNQGAKRQTNNDATEWLEPEIADLRNKVRDSEAKVADYRSKTDLLLGQNNSALATQQLSELSSELSRVRAARSGAEARAASLRSALKDGASLESLPEVLSSSLIQRLRERQVQLKADIADLSTTLLDNHPRIKALRSQLGDLDGQIRSEAQKVLKGIETELQTAQFREKDLVASLNTLKAESARVGEDEVELRALEREANSQRDLLESYLTRYREAASRKDRNYLPADARVFSRAVVPSEAYFPKKVPIIGAAFAGSLLLMGIGVLLSELFSGRAMRPAAGRTFEPVNDIAMPARAAASAAAEAAEADSAAMTATQAAERLIASGAGRALFVSPEGDAAAAASVLVAREIADTGVRVILLDLTSSGAASSPMLEGASLPGITNLLSSEAQFSEVIHADQYSDCHVIPAGTANAARAMRGIERLPIILEALSSAYEIIVVECGSSDADGLARLISEDAEIVLSVLDDTDPAVLTAAAGLVEAGYDDMMIVTAAGALPPKKPGRQRAVA
ncbi:MAG: exopolysaccharide transport family protein [Rhizobiaceae bacterium]